MLDPLSIIVGAVAGTIVGALGVAALARAFGLIEGPLGAAEYTTRHGVTYGPPIQHCAAELALAETSAIHAGRHDIAIRIHDIRGELADWGAA